MIYIDELREAREPWRGVTTCRLVSDESLEELLSFAGCVGLPPQWCQRAGVPPHFDLSPAWRERAVRACAVEVNCFDLDRIMAECKRGMPRARPAPAARG